MISCGFYNHSGMEIVVMSLGLGIIIGRLLNRKLLRLNDMAFSILSTIFVFFMGVSLGLVRSIVSGIGPLFVNAVLLALTASLGSILFTKVLGK